MAEQVYAGFWIRVGAAIIDSILMLVVVMPILTMIYGAAYWENTYFFLGYWDFLFNYVFPAIVVILFWVYKSATPGKMATRLTIVDARTGGKPSTGQFIGRYFAYFVSIIPLFLGILWVGIDKRKQGWHDKLVGTVVIRNTQPEPVTFEAGRREP